MSDGKPSGRSLRLGLVTETFPPEINGVARTLGRWVEAFQARGHQVQVLRPRQRGEARGANLVYGAGLPFYKQVRLGICGPGRVGEIFRRWSPDLVHIATEGPLGLAALVAAHRQGLPVASSFHTNFDHYATHYGFLGLEWLASTYLRWFHNRTRVTLVPSRATQGRLRASRFERVEIWSRGVDGNLFSPAHRSEELRRSLGLQRDDPLLLYVGRLAPEKNIPTLLQAFARLRQVLEGPLRDRLRLALVGHGPLGDSLEGSVPPGVVLAGVQTGPALSRWYASADVFAFPSLSETFGNVVLEAQASGLPTVGFDCQGVNEQVQPGITGFLVPVEGDLVPPLEQLCRDTGLRRTLGAAARARAEKLDWKPIFDGLEQRYVEIIAGARTAVG
ncbi:MAG: glycosyltransferase family 1 protein [Gemmataceae bacterium]